MNLPITPRPFQPPSLSFSPLVDVGVFGANLLDTIKDTNEIRCFVENRTVHDNDTPHEMWTTQHGFTTVWIEKYSALERRRNKR